MYSKAYNEFEAGFRAAFDADKAAWVKAQRKQLTRVSEVEDQSVFSVLLVAMYHVLNADKPNRQEIAADIFKQNLDLIKQDNLTNLWNFFTNDTAKDIINAWDKQSKEAYASTDNIEHVASYIKDEDLVAFFGRREKAIRALAKTEKREKIYSPIISMIYERRSALTPEIGRDLFMPYIDVIVDLSEFSHIRNALASKMARAGVSPVFLAWKQRRDAQGAVLLSFEDVDYFFENILQDEERIPFLKTCLPHIETYCKETEKTALKTIMSLFTHLKTEQMAWALARECFPYVKTQDDLEDLTEVWCRVVAKERTEKQTYQKEVLDQNQVEFVAAFNHYKAEAAAINVSRNDNTLFGKNEKVKSLDEHRQRKHKKEHKHKHKHHDDEKKHHHHRKSHH